MGDDSDLEDTQEMEGPGQVEPSDESLSIVVIILLLGAQPTLAPIGLVHIFNSMERFLRHVYFQICRLTALDSYQLNGYLGSNLQ